MTGATHMHNAYTHNKGWKHPFQPFFFFHRIKLTATEYIGQPPCACFSREMSFLMTLQGYKIFLNYATF